jgi:galactokinase
VVFNLAGERFSVKLIRFRESLLTAIPFVRESTEAESRNHQLMKPRPAAPPPIKPATNADPLVIPNDHFASRAARLFEKIHGHAPRWAAVAPGRVNLIGEHTDYNDGFVLPMAIERQTILMADRADERQATFHSMTTGETASFSLRGGSIPRGEPAWSNYVRGVVAGFQQLNLPLGGFNAVIDSDVPLGGGLSSSAALEVSTATLLEAMTGHSLAPVAKALLCQKAEHDYAGVPCGIMDQFVSVMGKKDHLLLLDCRSRATELVPMSDPGLAVLIINTNVRHKLADGEYARRRAQCEAVAGALKVRTLRDVTLEKLHQAREKLDEVNYRRARHVLTENDRTLQAAEALRAGNWPALGKLMYESHASLRDDYELSCRELDAVVEIAQGIGTKGGVFGCRMTGGGFGGCAVALVKASVVEGVGKIFAEGYERKTRNIATLFATRPGNAARVLTAADFTS